MQTYKSNLIHRLKIIRGHLNAVSQMIQNDKYCIFISQQIRAINGSLRKVDELILEHHLRICCHSKNNALNPKNNILQILKVFTRWN